MKDWPHCRLQTGTSEWRHLLLALLVSSIWMLPAAAETGAPSEAAVAPIAAQVPVQHIFHDQQGTSWIATRDNVQRLAGDVLEVVPSVGGVSDEIVAPFVDDGRGGVLFLTSAGLFVWEKGAVRRVPVRLPEGDAPVALYRDVAQRLWMGTHTGVYELVPLHDSAAPELPPSYSATLRASVHGPVTALEGDAAGNLWIGTSSDGLWRLDGNGLVRITRSGVAAAAVEDMRATESRPGTGSGAGPPATGWLAALYQTWYFDLLLVLSVAAVSAYLLRRKMQLMTGRLGIVLEERNRIASECHDTLMAGFAAISWQLEATAKLFRDDGSEATPAAKSCDLARSMVSHCQAEARRIIWDLRDTGEVTNVLSQALSRALSASHNEAAIETTLDVEGDEVQLAPGCVHHLVCIGQEAVSNAIRHAQPSRIVVNLRYDPDSLSLSIRDNGHGFLPSERTSRRGHFGIPVMEERARKLGGSLRIQTAAGAGTEVMVKVAFNAMQQPVSQQHHVIRWIGV